MFPNKIFLTCKEKNNITNKTWNKCLNKYREMYNDYQIKIYENEDIYRLVKKHFPEHLKLIKSLQNGGNISDTFRYLILYLEGGIYSDLDCLPLKHINALFKDKHFHGNNYNKFYIYPGDIPLNDNRWDFYINPCDNCKLMGKQNNILIYECLGHNYILPTTKIVICKEFSEIYQHTNNLNQLCQWFIIAQPYQKIFLDLYLQAIENLKKNIEDVLVCTGPKMFTKVINSSDVKDLVVLPCDFFCAGSGCKVPVTKNSYIHHQFTNSWIIKKKNKNKNKNKKT